MCCYWWLKKLFPQCICKDTCNVSQVPIWLDVIYMIYFVNDTDIYSVFTKRVVQFDFYDAIVVHGLSEIVYKFLYRKGKACFWTNM